MAPNIDRCRGIVERFLNGPWSVRCEDMIAKHGHRVGGCLLDALDATCSWEQRISIADSAARVIRQRYVHAFRSRRDWEAMQGHWHEAEIDDIINIVRRELSRVAPNASACADACSIGASAEQELQGGALALSDEEMAVAIPIIIEFGNVSYNASDWEKLIGNPWQRPYGCLIDAWKIPCTPDVRKDLSLAAAQKLRQEYPHYTKSPRAWKEKKWTQNDARRIATIVKNAIVNSLRQSQVPIQTESECPFDYAPGVPPNGFVPWRRFLARSPVSTLPGVYLFGYFPAQPPKEVEPLSEDVIYIGIAERQATGDRLQQFEKTALGSTGHSAGFTYRTEFVPKYFNNDLKKLKTFHGIYCSWHDIPSSSARTPRELEEHLLNQYRLRFGRWPVLNKKG